MAWGVDQMYELAGAYATAWASWLCIGNFGMGVDCTDLEPQCWGSQI